MLSHLHLDHLEGLPFFAPLWTPGAEVHIWAPACPRGSVAERIARYMSPPLFRVQLEDAPARVVLHELPEGDWTLGSARVLAEPVTHKRPTVGYRFDEHGRSLAYIPDHEPSLASGYRLATNASVLIDDAQYFEEEYKARIGWGHSGVAYAVSFARTRALALSGFAPIAETIRRDVRTIGLSLRVETPEDPSRVFELLNDPKAHVPLALNVGYGKDDLNGAGMFPPNFSRAAIGSAGSNYPLLGATAAQLRRWGYRVTQVPGVDERIAECQALAGGAQTQCWASLDQYLMERVVPWVPVTFESHVALIPGRIARYSFDQFAALPALDRIALRLDRHLD